MLTEARHQAIMTLLDAQHTVSLQQLVSALSVSESTIRRDLSQMEEDGRLVRIHGGAKRVFQLDAEAAYTEKVNQHADAKERIARYAADIVRDDEVIYLDAGTTTQAMIPFLKQARIIVVTNGVQHALQLAQQGIKTMMLGGQIKETTQAIIGKTAYEQLADYYFDRVFMGMNGIDDEWGYTTPDVEEAAIKQKAMQQGNKVYVLADASKIGKVSFSRVAEMSAATLITTHMMDQQKERLAKLTQVRECD